MKLKNNINGVPQTHMAFRIKFELTDFDRKNAVIVELINADQEMNAIKNKQKYDNLVQMMKQYETLS